MNAAAPSEVEKRVAVVDHKLSICLAPGYDCTKSPVSCDYCTYPSLQGGMNISIITSIAVSLVHHHPS